MLCLCGRAGIGAIVVNLAFKKPITVTSVATRTLVGAAVAAVVVHMREKNQTAQDLLDLSYRQALEKIVRLLKQTSANPEDTLQAFEKFMAFVRTCSDEVEDRIGPVVL